MAPHKVLCWHALGCTAATPTSAASSVQMCIPWQPSRRRDAPHKISRISSVLQFNGRRPAGPTLVPNDFDIEVVGLDHHDYAQNKFTTPILFLLLLDPAKLFNDHGQIFSRPKGFESVRCALCSQNYSCSTISVSMVVLNF